MWCGCNRAICFVFYDQNSIVIPTFKWVPLLTSGFWCFRFSSLVYYNWPKPECNTVQKLFKSLQISFRQISLKRYIEYKGHVWTACRPVVWLRPFPAVLIRECGSTCLARKTSGWKKTLSRWQNRVSSQTCMYLYAQQRTAVRDVNVDPWHWYWHTSVRDGSFPLQSSLLKCFWDFLNPSVLSPLLLFEIEIFFTALIPLFYTD